MLAAPGLLTHCCWSWFQRPRTKPNLSMDWKIRGLGVNASHCVKITTCIWVSKLLGNWFLYIIQNCKMLFGQLPLSVNNQQIWCLDLADATHALPPTNYDAFLHWTLVFILLAVNASNTLDPYSAISAFGVVMVGDVLHGNVWNGSLVSCNKHPAEFRLALEKKKTLTLTHFGLTI